MIIGAETMNKRLKSARIAAGFRSASAAIEALNWNASKYRAHENGQNNFSAADAVEYGKAYNVSPGWLLTGEDAVATIEQACRQNERVSIYAAENTPRLLGYVEEGAWREVSENLEDESDLMDRIYLMDQKYPANIQFDLKVIDDSVNKFACNGDFLRCVVTSLDKLDENSLAVIERVHNNSLRQIIIRRARVLDDGCEFFSESSSAKYARFGSFRISGKQNRESARVIGRVVFQYKMA